MRISLRRRLLAILISMVMLVWLLSVGFTAVHSRSVVVKQIDERLHRYADMASHTMEMVMGNPEVEAHFEARSTELGASPYKMVSGIGSTEEQAINLWFKDSQVLVGADTPAFPFPEREGLVTVNDSDREGAREWRVIYRYLPSIDSWLGVGVDLDHARRNGAATTWQLTLPLLIVMPLTALLLIAGVWRGLRPLHKLASHISARKPQAMAPLSKEDVPVELDPVIDALNDLLARLERALASESRFTANAAHELQTPLSAIKAEVQRCLRLENDQETREMLRRIDQRVRRSTDTVSQLLTLARLDPDQEFSRYRFDLGETLLEVIADHADMAIDRGLELDLDLDEGVLVEGNCEWLRILLRNLVINAFKYAHKNSSVVIWLRADATRVECSIANHCTPLGSEVFGRLGDRFYRPEGQRETGVGLGLSIARRVAELHGACLRLEPQASGEGFIANLHWPR